MLIEILKRTPSWVFVLFIVLLAVGYFQSKDRTVGRGVVAVLPIVMIALSFSGVLAAFGVAPLGLIGWLAGAAAAVWLGVKFIPARGVVFSAATRSFSVPGSWLPLAMMMAIFFTKFAVAVIQARQFPMAGEPVFIGVVSLCYGIFGGVFGARAVSILRSPQAAG